MTTITDDVEIIKIYCYYYENRLYAWTTDKKLKKQFELERGLEKFTYKKVELIDEYYRVFANKHNSSMIIAIPLYDGNRWILVLSNAYESDILDSSQSQIYDDILTIRSCYKQYRQYYKESVVKTMNAATQITNHYENKQTNLMDEILEINTFALFYYLFKDTFTFKEV